MECPSCGHDNLPGADHCAQCQTSLTQEDVPTALIRSRYWKSDQARECFDLIGENLADIVATIIEQQLI